MGGAGGGHVAILFLATLGGYIVYDSYEGAIPQGNFWVLGYWMPLDRDDPSTRMSGNMPDNTMAQFHFQKEGMLCQFTSAGDVITVGKDQAADTFTTSIDMLGHSPGGRWHLLFRTNFNVGEGIGLTVQVEASIDQYQT